MPHTPPHIATTTDTDRRGATRAGARVTAGPRSSRGRPENRSARFRSARFSRALESGWVAWIEVGESNRASRARSCASAREASLGASVGHAHVHQRAKPACVRSRGWIPDHEHRCRSLTADPGAVLVDRKHARLRRPIVREALEVIKRREKPVAANGLHGDVRRVRGRFLR